MAIPFEIDLHEKDKLNLFQLHQQIEGNFINSIEFYTVNKFGFQLT